MTAGEQTRAERWLCMRLAQHRVAVTLAGDIPARMGLRAAITGAGLEVVIAGRGRDRKPFTYAEAFERLYDQALADHPRASREGGLPGRGKSSRRSTAYEELPA